MVEGGQRNLRTTGETGEIAFEEELCGKGIAGLLNFSVGTVDEVCNLIGND